jgi:hypothetical protein
MAMNVFDLVLNMFVFFLRKIISSILRLMVKVGRAFYAIVTLLGDLSQNGRRERFGKILQTL